MQRVPYVKHSTCKNARFCLQVLGTEDGRLHCLSPMTRIWMWCPHTSEWRVRGRCHRSVNAWLAELGHVGHVYRTTRGTQVWCFSRMQGRWVPVSAEQQPLPLYRPSCTL